MAKKCLFRKAYIPMYTQSNKRNTMQWQKIILPDEIENAKAYFVDDDFDDHSVISITRRFTEIVCFSFRPHTQKTVQHFLLRRRAGLIDWWPIGCTVVCNVPVSNQFVGCHAVVADFFCITVQLTTSSDGNSAARRANMVEPRFKI